MKWGARVMRVRSVSREDLLPLLLLLLLLLLLPPRGRVPAFAFE